MYTGSEIASRLASLCITLNEAPIIRYQNGSEFAKLIATLVHTYLSEYKIRNPLHWSHGDASHSERERGVLLVVDRSYDPLTPLMHEYTYQSLAQDLLTIKENVIDVKVTTNAGETQDKEALLSESDDLWVELRHMHIAKVIQAISLRMKDIIQNNSSAALAKGDQNGSGTVSATY
jgi:Sec1 family